MLTLVYWEWFYVSFETSGPTASRRAINHTSYLVRRPYTLEVRVGAGDSRLQREEHHPTVTEQAPEDQLQIRPGDPQPPMSFQVSRHDGLLQQNEYPELHERPQRREMVTAWS